MKKPFFKLEDRIISQDTAIVDVNNNLNFCFLAQGGMGLRSDTRDLGQHVCDYLNSLPENDPFLTKWLK